MKRLALLLLPLLLAGTATAAGTAPTASFTTSPAKPYAQQTVSFDGSASTPSSGTTITSYSWKFGDGGTATTSTPTTTHAYATAGSYTAQLTVTDSGGHTSTPATETISVSADVPEAHFKISPRSPYAGHTVTFNASKSTDPAGHAIVSYMWSFGDGAGVTTTTPKTTHVYGQAGPYTVTLIVTDSAGNKSAAKTRTVTVRVPPSKPTASFTFTPAHPGVGTTVRFDGSSSSVGGATITAYMWSFGDGASATTTTPVAYHAYTTLGPKIVHLVVVSSQKKRASAEHVVTVLAPRLSRLHVRVCARHSPRCHRIGLKVHFRLSVADAVTLTVRRAGHHHVLGRVTVQESAGAHAVKVGFHGTAGRRYVLSATPAGGARRRRHFRWP